MDLLPRPLIPVSEVVVLELPQVAALRKDLARHGYTKRRPFPEVETSQSRLELLPELVADFTIVEVCPYGAEREACERRRHVPWRDELEVISEGASDFEVRESGEDDGLERVRGEIRLVIVAGEVDVVYLFCEREVAADLEDAEGGRGLSEEGKELVLRLALESGPGALPLEVSEGAWRDSCDQLLLIFTELARHGVPYEMEGCEVLGFGEDAESRTRELAACCRRREEHTDERDVADPFAWVVVDLRRLQRLRESFSGGDINERDRIEEELRDEGVEGPTGQRQCPFRLELRESRCWRLSRCILQLVVVQNRRRWCVGLEAWEAFDGREV